MKKSIKEAAKKGQTDVAKILAKELIQSRKAVGKLYASKAHMNSVVMSMQHQLCENGVPLSLNIHLLSHFFSCSSHVEDGRGYREEYRGHEGYAASHSCSRDIANHDGTLQGDDEGTRYWGGRCGSHDPSCDHHMTPPTGRDDGGDTG